MLTSTIIYAHATFLIPEPRKKHYMAFDAKNACGTFNDPYTKYKPTLTTKRGSEIETQWEKNNHGGGFIRYSIVPMNMSSEIGIFAKKENIFYYECADKKCSAPNPGLMDPITNPSKCFGKISIPGWVTDGDYTIQTSWYGAGSPSPDGSEEWTNDPFQHCFDITVNGGTTDDKPTCPAIFKGGDDEGPTDCHYIKTTLAAVETGCHGKGNCICKYKTDRKECYERSKPKDMCDGATDGATDDPSESTTTQVPELPELPAAPIPYAPAPDSLATDPVVASDSTSKCKSK